MATYEILLNGNLSSAEYIINGSPGDAWSWTSNNITSFMTTYSLSQSQATQWSISKTLSEAQALTGSPYTSASTPFTYYKFVVANPVISTINNITTTNNSNPFTITATVNVPITITSISNLTSTDSYNLSSDGQTITIYLDRSATRSSSHTITVTNSSGTDTEVFMFQSYPPSSSGGSDVIEGEGQIMEHILYLNTVVPR